MEDPKQTKKSRHKTTTILFAPQELEDIDLRLKNYPKVSRHEFMRWAVRKGLQALGSMENAQIYRELDELRRMDEDDRFKV